MLSPIDKYAGGVFTPDDIRTLVDRRPECNWLRFDGGLTWQPVDKLDLQSTIHAHQLDHGYDSQLLTAESWRKAGALRCALSIASCSASAASSGLRLLICASRYSCRWWR